MTESIYQTLPGQIGEWARELGFQEAGIADTDLTSAELRLADWLGRGYAGDMTYLSRHGSKRTRPAELIEGTRSIIMVRMDYLASAAAEANNILASDKSAYISRYALGRDYHKLIRKRLVKLWDRIASALADAGEAGFQGRVFTDSGPVMEKPLAEKAGLGWIGKNTLLLNRRAGSWFFLGTIYTNAPIPANSVQPRSHCGSCHACLDVCPTDAFPEPWILDARRCISYLTIEHRGSIPAALRPLMGNRVFGCDDCQLVCPWNRYAQWTREEDFSPRHQLDSATLVDLINWSEAEFLSRTEGSAIRRTGYDGWRRNLAVGIGNGTPSGDAISALTRLSGDTNEIVAEHAAWAVARLTAADS